MQEKHLIFKVKILLSTDVFLTFIFKRYFPTFMHLKIKFRCLIPKNKKNFTFPTVIYNRGKVLESAQENSKISSCFVLWEP